MCLQPTVPSLTHVLSSVRGAESRLLGLKRLGFLPHSYNRDMSPICLPTHSPHCGILSTRGALLRWGPEQVSSHPYRRALKGWLLFIPQPLFSSLPSTITHALLSPYP